MPRFNSFESSDPEPWADIAADRAECPVHRIDAPGGFSYYQVNRWDLIREVNRRHDIFSNREGVVPRGAEPEGEQVLEYTDPPTHTFHRQLIGKAFSAARVNERAERIQQIADDLVDAIVAKGNRFRLRRQFARLLPSQTISEILGIPDHEREQFIAWTEVGELNAGEPVPEEAAREAKKAFLDYSIAQLRDRKANPRDDLLSTIMHAQVDGERLTETEAAALVRLLLGAGNGTTSIALSNTIYQLEKRPDQKARFLADIDGLTNSTVEEGLRFDCPVQGNLRGVIGAAEIGGVRVEPGDRLYSFYTSGNHDPDKYDRPDEFIVDRDWTKLPRHFAFGFGIHFCVGADLARIETRIGLSTLYKRLPGLRIAPDCQPKQIGGLVFRTWDEIEMVFEGPVAPRLSGAA
jgi:cytochrome P450